MAAETTYRDALAAARLTMAKGDLRTAQIEILNAVKTYPNNPDVHALLAEIDLRLGNSPAAEEEARLARWHGGNDDEIAPVLAQAMLQQDKMSELIHEVAPAERSMTAEAIVRRALAEAHIALGEVALGRSLLKDAQRLDPGSEQTHISIARLDLVQGDLAGAQQELAAAREIDPDAIDGLRLEADLMRSKGDYKGALAAYEKAIKTHPRDLTLLVGRAMILISQNRLDDAQRDVDMALEEAPYSLTPNFLAGVLLARRGELKKADDTLTAISGSFPSVPDGFYVLGGVKYAEGQYDSAIFFLAQYVARRPDDLNARLLLANAAIKKNDPARAISVLSPVVYQKQPDPRSVALLAQAYIAAGRGQDAIVLYQQEAAAKPDNPSYSAEAAVAELAMGSATKGTEDLEKLVATDGGLQAAGPVYVMNELRIGEIAKAETVAERLVAKNGSDVMAQLLLSFVRMAQLRDGEAESLLKGIVARDPNFTIAKYNLARLYRDTSRPSQAKQIYETLVQQQPGDVVALMGLAQLAQDAGDLSEAAKWLKAVQDTAPKDASPTKRIVDMYARAKDWPDAVAAARELETRMPAPDTIGLLAATLAASGDTNGAIKTLMDYLSSFDGSVGLYRALAAYQRRAGDLGAARKSVEAALSFSSTDEGAMTDLVDIDLQKDGETAALKTARSFAVRAPEFSDLLAANLLDRTGHVQEAIAVLKEGEIYHPSVRNNGRIAELTYEEGQHDAAVAMLRKLMRNSDEIPLWLSLANMEMLDGHDAEAISLYQEVLTRMPNEVLSLNNLATLYEAKHDPRALEVALHAYRLAPNPKTADTLGWAFVENGDSAKALPYLEVAGAGQPDALEVQYHLAVALQASGAVERARLLLERLVAAKAPFIGKDDAQRRLAALQHG